MKRSRYEQNVMEYVFSAIIDLCLLHTSIILESFRLSDHARLQTRLKDEIMVNFHANILHLDLILFLRGI